MRNLPAIPEVILLDFVPKPGEIQGLIARRLPGLPTSSDIRSGRSNARRRPTPVARAEGFILLDFVPALGTLSRVIKEHRPAVTAAR